MTLLSVSASLCHYSSAINLYLNHWRVANFLSFCYCCIIITLDTLEQASIPPSPNDSIANYGLNDFPLVMPRHGDGCIEVGGFCYLIIYFHALCFDIISQTHVLYHQKACESMNEMLLKAIASRELGIKKGDDLGDGGSSSDTPFNRDKVPLYIYHFRVTT